LRQDKHHNSGSRGALDSLFGRIFCGKPVPTFPENAFSVRNPVIENKENFAQTKPVPTDLEVDSAVQRLSPNWTRPLPRAGSGHTSRILQSLAHGRSHSVVVETKRSPRRRVGSP
jgi:hypothetical protein